MEVDEPLFKEWLIRDAKEEMSNFATSFCGRISVKGNEDQNLTLNMLNSRWKNDGKVKDVRSRSTLVKKLDMSGPQ